jgi:hypothetical protein
MTTSSVTARDQILKISFYRIHFLFFKKEAKITIYETGRPSLQENEPRRLQMATVRSAARMAHGD